MASRRAEILRHVHNRFDAGLERGLSELGCRLNQTRPDGVDEIGAVHALEGFAHGVEVCEIAGDNLRPSPAQSLGPFVLAMDEGANMRSLVEKLRRCGLPWRRSLPRRGI